MPQPPMLDLAALRQALTGAEAGSQFPFNVMKFRGAGDWASASFLGSPQPVGKQIGEPRK